jgi:phage tail-like protein
MKGTFERRPLTVLLMDLQGGRARTWHFSKAFPVKWVGPDMKASQNGIAIETVEFAHEGIVGI